MDYGSILGLVTLVDRRGFPSQLDAVGRFAPQTIFQIQSMTKPFVSASIMMLVEQGKIPSVDHKVSSLPGFGDFPHREMTIRQLLTHTSGIWYRQQPQPGSATGTAPHLTNRLDREPGITVRDKRLKFIARHYANANLYPLQDFTPQYSNIGFTMLGWIIEELSGQPLDRFMKERLFDELGMKDTFFFPDSASMSQRDRIADLDRRLPDPPDYSHYDKMRRGWVYASPEGGIYSTAEDLRRFLGLFRHGGQIPGRPRLLNRSSVALLMEDQVPNGDYGCGGQLGRSLGFYVVRQTGCSDYPGHSPGTISHGGRFSTFFWFDPKKDEIGVFLYQIVTRGDSTPSFAERDALWQMLERIAGR